MKKDEIYEAWKKEKRQIEVSHNFTDQVMDKVYQWMQSRKSSPLNIEGLIELISFHPLAKVGLVAVGAVVGIIRVIIMILAVLSNGVVNG